MKYETFEVDDSRVTRSAPGMYASSNGGLQLDHQHPFGLRVWIGVVFILVAFVLLVDREHRVVLTEHAYDQAGREAVDVDLSSSPDPALNGRVVFGSASVASGLLEDDLFKILARGQWLKRHVENFQWIEKGVMGETDAPNFQYERSWVEGLLLSSEFAFPMGHTNPLQPLIPSAYFQLENSSFLGTGGYVMDEAILQKFLAQANERTLGLNDLNLSLVAEALATHPSIELQENAEPVGPLDLSVTENDEIYITAGPRFEADHDQVVQCSIERPCVGDTRVRFLVANESVITILAQQQKGGVLSQFHARDGEEVSLIVFVNGSSRSAFVGTYENAVRANEWNFRYLAFGLCVVGFSGVFPYIHGKGWLGGVTVFFEELPRLREMPLGSISFGFVSAIVFVTVLTTTLWAVEHWMIALSLIAVVLFLLSRSQQSSPLPPQTLPEQRSTRRPDTHGSAFVIV